ncbi:hypothetical protein [Oceanicoccus sp. KOV_DT_Chl]|uniref:hypothetical protein n=1 Tax=Oceanicoccus sp. KOV_DT_Chl TaxID=1904639 RepID=UPI000C7B15A9|nr:hypothetical protein [Oceanicoccus sp. KOV_DT_Chl]
MMTVLSFFKKYWLQLALWLIIFLPVFSFILVSVVLLVFMYWPQKFEAIDFTQFSTDQSRLVLLAHGVKDNTESWVDPLKKTYQQHDYPGQIMALDWSSYAQNPLRCAIEAKRIGHLVGKQIVQSKNLVSAHLIAHSCGAFIIYAACEAIKANNSEVVVHTTYLDPLSIYGIDSNYGLRHFGSCADYSDAYIDTEDGVTGSNVLIPNTHTYDVTAIRLRTNHSSRPHNWPTLYFQQLVADGVAPDYFSDRRLKERSPAGVLEVLD